MDFAIAWTGKPYREAVKQVKQVLGVAKVETTQFQSNDYEKNKNRLKQIHKRLQVLGKSDIALCYLAQRGLSVIPEKDCYFCPSLAYYEEGNIAGEYSAIVSAFRNVSEETSTYHITYLDGAKKAEVSSPKKILPAIRPLTGSAIKLFKPEKGVLAVAEGIETALAVHQLEGLPVWAAGNAQLMAAMEIPADIKELHIYADSDESFTGQQAAYTLAKKYASKGVKVRVHLIIAGKWEVENGQGGDFLDYLIIENHQKQLGSIAA